MAVLDSRRAGWLRLGLALALLAAGAGAAELPAVACVEAVRRARVEGATSGPAAARARLEAALALPDCELPALVELVSWYRGAEPSGAISGELLRRLVQQLEDPSVVSPVGLVRSLALLPASPEQIESLLAALEQRRALAGSRQPPPSAAEREELLVGIADLQTRLDRHAETRATLALLLELRPYEGWRWRALDLDLRLERWQDAARGIESLLAEPAAPAEYLRPLYVTTLARLGRYEQMLAEIERLPAAEAPLPGEPDSPRVELLVDAAWALRDAGRDAEAETVFRRVLAADPDHEGALAALLHLYGSAEEIAAARAELAARRAREEDPQALYEEGTDLLTAGDVVAAHPLLARAAPGLAGTSYAEAAWYNLGLAAYKLKRDDEAARAFEQASALAPTRADPYLRRGLALHRAGRCAEAIAPLARAVELQPDLAAGHYYLGECLAKNGDETGAARARERYRRLQAGG